MQSIEGASGFPERLKALRIARGLSQLMLADALGTSKVTIWKWECGQTMPTRTNLEKLAARLDTTAQDLLFGDEAAAADSQPELNLRDLIDEAKLRIAEIAGTSADKVTITVEY